MEMKLNPEPDAYGFLYGSAKDGDTHYNVNVMPPQHEWRGQFELEGYSPHATASMSMVTRLFAHALVKR